MKKLFIFSAIFLSFGILVRPGGGLSNTVTILGVLFICISMLIGLLMFSSWRRYNRIMNEVAGEYEKNGSEYIFEISNDSIKFRDFQTQMELKWSAFKHYTVYKGYIILIPKNSIVGAFLFDKNDKSEADKCEQLLEILKDKLQFVES